MPRVSATGSRAFVRRSDEFEGLDSLGDLYDSCSEQEEQEKESDLLNILKKPRVCSPDSVRVHDWSTLPRDVSRLIADKIRFFPHLQKFCVACKEWRNLIDEVIKIGSDQPPLLLLPYNKETQTSTFLELEHSKMYDLKMPWLKDRWICGCSKGWLALLDDNFVLSLLNPLTLAEIKLPPLDPSKISSLMPYNPFCDRESFISRVVLSDDPSLSGCFAAIIYSQPAVVGVCRLGDANWTVQSKYYPFDNVIFYQGKLFAHLRTSDLVIFDYGGESGLSVLRRIPPPMLGTRGDQLDSHLSVSSGQLLLTLRVAKDGRVLRGDGGPFKTFSFGVFKLTEDMKSWERVYSLGEQCLFVGLNDSILVETKDFPWCKSNCIYFTNDVATFWRAASSGYQWDNGVYSLEENCVIGELDIRHSLSFWPSPALWYPAKDILLNIGHTLDRGWTKSNLTCVWISKI